MIQKRFGKNPAGERLERIKKSPNYKNGEFQNLTNTPQLAEGKTIPGIIYDKLFKKFPNLKPLDQIPSIKTDIHQLDPNTDVLIWFGHSSYYLQVNGIKILVDPVFSGNASPIANSIKSFEGSNNYSVFDFPDLDYLFISHDHYDHLDYKTIIQLKDKVETVICGLGVGSHFEYWGYDASKIIEKDWYESLELKNNLTLHIEPARHFSGRTLAKNKTLWVSFVLKTPNLTLFLGGDSGYESHYEAIGQKHGPFDLAIMENGQYNESWPFIHHTPDQVLKAAKDLKAKRVLPVHSGKFNLSSHPWDEPLRRLSELNEDGGVRLLTPMIGEVLELGDLDKHFNDWWVGVK
jgi:L-ascorbate metabolism protein UlaG (beta-lactamase superfamily)